MAKKDKVSEADFDKLLEEYEYVIVARGKPGASTMHAALHKVRQALLEAARRGVDDSEPAVTEESYRQALVESLAGFPSKGTRAIIPAREIEIGLKRESPMGIGSIKAYEVENALHAIHTAYPALEISAGSVNLATLEEGANEHDLIQMLRRYGADAWHSRPENEKRIKALQPMPIFRMKREKGFLNDRHWDALSDNFTNDELSEYLLRHDLPCDENTSEKLRELMLHSIPANYEGSAKDGIKPILVQLFNAYHGLITRKSHTEPQVAEWLKKFLSDMRKKAIFTHASAC